LAFAGSVDVGRAAPGIKTCLGATGTAAAGFPTGDSEVTACFCGPDGTILGPEGRAVTDAPDVPDTFDDAPGFSGLVTIFVGGCAAGDSDVVAMAP
jgi:hypothetical protein